MLAKDEAIAAHHEKLLRRDNEIEHLKLVIAKLRRMIVGTKSEKVTREIEQLELKLEELETGKAERVSRQQPTRMPLPGTSQLGARCLRICPVKCTPALADAVIDRGIPEQVRSDNGPEFVPQNLHKCLAATEPRRCTLSWALRGRMATPKVST